MIFPAPCELPEFETIMDALEKSIAIAKASNDAACDETPDEEPTYWGEKAKDRREEFLEEDARSRGEI